MLAAMLDVEFVSELTGFIIENKKSDEELWDYILKTNIQKKLWVVAVDVLTNVNVLYRLSRKPKAT
jgi:hypothetical protein